MRKALNEIETEPRFLVSDRNSVSLASSPDVWVDLVEFERLASTRADEEGAVEAWEQAVGLWQGALLEGIHLRAGAEWDEWLIVTAERARRHLAGVLRSLAIHHERAGDWERSLSFADRLTEVDPWDEGAHRQCMRLLTRIGESARALHLFSGLRERLDTELDSDPADETTTLAEKIRTGDLSGAVPETEILYPFFLAETQSDVAAPLFVGRRRELEFLQSHLDAALAGRGHVVLVAGEAGSGKTMLAAEFRDLATAFPDVLVAQGRCNAYAGLGDPYLPFREILGALTGDVESLFRSGATSREQATRLWEAIPHSARLVYERGPSLLSVVVSGTPLVERVEQAMPGAEWLDGLRLHAEAMTRRPPVPERMQPALFDEYTAVLEGLAPTHPLLLIVDDLQWSDLGSIALFWHLARRLDGQRILIVGLYRPEEIAAAVGATHPLEPVLHELRSVMPDRSIELGPDRLFVEALVDSEPNELGTDFRDRLFALTDGHPLFTVEMLRDMQERADVRRNQAGVWSARDSLDWERLPTRVESVIAQRIARLPRDLQTDLTVAAVQGEGFDAETVAVVMEDPEAQARMSMESTSPHRIIEPSGVSRVNGRLIARYRFRHILFQRYLYDQLDEAERVRLHEETGRALEGLYRSHPEPPVVDLAHHFEEAGLTEPAITYLQLAGQRAFRMSANEEAIRHLQRATDLLDDVPESTERDTLELGLLVALAASLMAVRGYTAPELERIGRRVLELCDHLEPSPMTALALT
ncbi:MAG: AAA family ATPase, partial [Actinomycetota bacterium]|nr:AAA family ATPase [Actinomycetota bacterium]